MLLVVETQQALRLTGFPAQEIFLLLQLMHVEMAPEN
jgi:hypothetical protein